MTSVYTSKQSGNAFEELFQLSCKRSSVNYTRVPDGGRMVFVNGRRKFIPVRSPFDYIINRGRFAAVLDTKTIDGKRFAFSDITRHQIESMLPISVSIPAGYCIYFREPDAVSFISVRRLAKVRSGESLGVEDGLALGPGNNFNPGLILEWVDDGKSEDPLYQQRLF